MHINSYKIRLEGIDAPEMKQKCKKDYNCYVVGYTENVGEEIANIINNPFSDNHKEILENAKKLLQKHIDIKWF